MKKTVLFRVPSEEQDEFRSLWKQLRLADSLTPEFDLNDPEMYERFDANAMAEWIVPLTTSVAPIVTAILGYLAARKGEVEIQSGPNEIKKFRNLTPRQIKEVMEVIEAESKDES